MGWLDKVEKVVEKSAPRIGRCGFRPLVLVNRWPLEWDNSRREEELGRGDTWLCVPRNAEEGKGGVSEGKARTLAF